MINIKFILIAAAVIVIISLLATSFYIIDQAEEGVVTRFGKYHTTTGPGLNFKLPWGIDRHYVVNVRSVQTEQFGFRTARGGNLGSFVEDERRESTMLTGDLNIVEVQWILQYRISDSRAWVFNVLERHRTIQDVSRSTVNMLVGDRTIMDVMGAERNAIQLAALDIMNDTFRGYGLGINVITVQLQNIEPPRGVQAAFEDVNRAEQDMNRLINEGQVEYNREIPRARGEAERYVLEAQGYATERVNRANGEVARFNYVFNEYARAPDVTRQRIYYETMERIFKEDDRTTIIDRSFNNFLPLRDLTQRN
jgi:membrane protease subunit HflK